VKRKTQNEAAVERNVREMSTFVETLFTPPDHGRVARCGGLERERRFIDNPSTNREPKPKFFLCDHVAINPGYETKVS
jgi:hypothetical protein